ncbi:ATP-dependent zinc metalloprotease FtsH [compost metagenome]
MAAADQIKSLIKSFGEGDEERFFATSMQIAASEARMGHTTFAQELKKLIEKAKKERSLTLGDNNRTISISLPKRELNELIDVFQPKIKLKDMILNPTTSEILERIIDEQNKSELLQKYNLHPQRKLLLTGPPGSGKTMTAQAIAGELNLPVFIVRLDGLISKFMGESISKLRIIFDTMETQRAVYLFDEFDSIGSHRDQNMEVGEIKRVLNSFLINIERDESNSIIIAATNLPETLDKALFRRFDSIIAYPLPSQTEISNVIKRNLKGFTLDQDFNIKEASRRAEGLNYADIVRACEEAIKSSIISGKLSIESNTLYQSIENRKR